MEEINVKLERRDILDKRERLILKMRFGILSGSSYKRHTLEEVGKELNITRERIRQLEAKALEKAKRIMQKIDEAVITYEEKTANECPECDGRNGHHRGNCAQVN